MPFSGDQMLHEEIQAELRRLQLHPVNLDAAAGENGKVLLKGSLITHWAVPQIIDGKWFLTILNGLPDIAGPEATMNAYLAAHARSAPT
jgi:hypothetical protein